MNSSLSHSKGHSLKSKSPNNMIPKKQYQAKFIVAKDTKNKDSKMEDIMDNYLKHYSCGKDMNNSLFHAHSQAKISGLNEMNMSRGASNSSKRSLNEKKIEYKERIEKLKSRLGSTKKTSNLKKATNHRYNQTDIFSNSVVNYQPTNYASLRDEAISPTNFKIARPTACGIYQVNHPNCNNSILSHSMLPNAAVASSNDLNKSRSLSYYSSSNYNKREESKQANKKKIREYKLDAAELIADRIKNQMKKYFRKLKSYCDVKRKLQPDMPELLLTDNYVPHTTYKSIQPEINRKRNQSKRDNNMNRLSSNSKRDKSQGYKFEIKHY